MPRDKVSKLGTYRRDCAVDFRAVGSFEETIWTTGEAIAGWSLSLGPVVEDHRTDGMPIGTATRRLYIRRGLANRTSNKQRRRFRSLEDERFTEREIEGPIVVSKEC